MNRLARTAVLAAIPLFALSACEDLGAGLAPGASGAPGEDVLASEADITTGRISEDGGLRRQLLAEPDTAEDSDLVAAPVAASVDDSDTGGGFFARLFAPRNSAPEVDNESDDRLLTRVGLVGGRVVVAGPVGYCIDPKTLNPGGATGFAVLASCRILSPSGKGSIVSPGLVTVTVGAKGSARSLPTSSGLAASAGGPILGAFESGDLAMVHMAGGGREVLSDGDPRYWRAAFAIGDRLVGLALYAPRDASLAGADGAALLRAVRDQIRANSP